jgi:aminodeoxyfutalosine deaminase
MERRFLTADWVYPVSSPRLSQGVVVIDDNRIVDVTSREKVPGEKLEYFKGILIPGFINTHCHLELSHLKGVAPSGTGLLPFLKHVVTLRDTDQASIDKAIEEADAYMWESGIQAVGDICNKADTFPVKQKSKIQYYSFVEMFDFLQEERSEEMIRGYLEAYEKAPSPKSAVPHAPYTVTRTLFDRINQLNDTPSTVSIHNQETQAEADLFINGSGDFFTFFKNFGLDIGHFIPTGISSIHYAIKHMDPGQRTLFVHNTLTTPRDIEVAHAWNDSVYWATCANANLYIENKLPNYQYFIEAGARMTIGTDSLTSNWQLSVLEEIKTISRFQSFVQFDTLLQWATLNGAQALGMDDRIGSLEKGKTPGVLNLSFDPDRDFLFDSIVTVKRLV